MGILIVADQIFVKPLVDPQHLTSGGENLGWYLVGGELCIAAFWTALTSPPLTHNAQVLITYTPSTTWDNT